MAGISSFFIWLCVKFMFSLIGITFNCLFFCVPTFSSTSIQFSLCDLRAQLNPPSVQARRLLLDPAIHEQFTRLKVCAGRGLVCIWHACRLRACSFPGVVSMEFSMHRLVLRGRMMGLINPVKGMEFSVIGKTRFLLRFRHVADRMRAIDGKNVLILNKVAADENPPTVDL
ncbi:FKBP12-interacting protein of [Sesamum alatum]|uniref:FKBP12-interacting protein of n=1 Tax=Sesamum alatum TaxID=300844 RepID=A0AAE1YBB7_9LAMI|nr:FKBP12-interacting protein of [Sesamum alatum]